jgi:hypothetical protein
MTCGPVPVRIWEASWPVAGVADVVRHLDLSVGVSVALNRDSLGSGLASDCVDVDGANWPHRTPRVTGKLQFPDRAYALHD